MEINKMKKIFNIIGAASALLLALASCQKPHYVLPTADRDGFTSLSAYFTSGNYNGMELARLAVTDEMIAGGRLVVKVPYYYPETSDNTTTIYMSSVRMKAELDKNCSISPALTLLDLNLDNEFVYTDAKGTKWPIIITGVRAKSDEATFISFSLTGLFEGFVDNEERKIYLYTTDDLSSCTAEGEVSAHSSIVTDLSKPLNYNEPQTIVIASHSGKKIEYTTEKATPTKIRSGFNANSIKQLFNFDPKSRLGTPDYFTKGIVPSLAVVENNLVVALGNGAKPFAVHGTTGAKIGEITTGSAPYDVITSDEAGNMLLCNSTTGENISGDSGNIIRESLKIYRTSSISVAPTLFYEYENKEALPLGPHMKVSGDISGDAVITFPYGGVAGITTASKFLVLTVRGGAVTAANVYDTASLGLGWGAFDSAGSAGVAPASSNPEDGYFLCYYSDNTLNYLNSSLALERAMPTTDGNSWAWNVNTLDCKMFNNVNYLALLVLAHFPAWGGQPHLYIYNVNDKNALTGEFTSSDALVLKNEAIESYNATNADETVSSGSVILSQSADGFKFFIYYYDQYCGSIGGYSADCIKR